jgi:hypothetical protein
MIEKRIVTIIANGCSVFRSTAPQGKLLRFKLRFEVMMRKILRQNGCLKQKGGERKKRFFHENIVTKVKKFWIADDNGLLIL